MILHPKYKKALIGDIWAHIFNKLKNYDSYNAAAIGAMVCDTLDTMTDDQFEVLELWRKDNNIILDSLKDLL